MSDIPAASGGQIPTNEPRSGPASSDEASSVRDRLKAPAGRGEQSGPGDSRVSDISSTDFEQTDSRAGLRGNEHGAAQIHRTQMAPEHVREPRLTDIDEGAARSAERKVAALFLSSVVGVIGFVVTYVAAPYKFAVQPGNQYYTPLLGAFMALALGGIGAGAVLWAKTLMVDEEAVQDRHEKGSSPEDLLAATEFIKDGYAKSGLPRRKLLRNSLLLGAGSLAVLPVPLLFGLGRFQHKEDALRHTSWKKGSRLIRSDGTAVRMGDVAIGGVETVFPDVPEGNTKADSASLIIRMRPDELHQPAGRQNWSVEGHVVYSIICTHLGCPVKLYEQQTHHLFCPCHQSTFDMQGIGKPLFGPAARPLPQLAISVDADGYFVAQGDYSEPVGPSFWERKP